MKVRNKTTWRTDHLRRYVREIALRELSPTNRRRTTVEFREVGRNGHSRSVHGHVWIHGDGSGDMDRNGGDVVIFLPRPWDESAAFRQQVAMVLAHEFAHIATGGFGRRWELRKRASPRYGYGYERSGTVGAYREFYHFALTWDLDPA